jgi:hypothetical protein
LSCDPSAEHPADLVKMALQFSYFFGGRMRVVREDALVRGAFERTSLSCMVSSVILLVRRDAKLKQ